MYKQQKQTENYFNKDATNWSKKSSFKKSRTLNTIHQRNLYVINQFKKFKLKNLIDVGCGVGDLSYEISKIGKQSVGIDFSKNMIRLAKKKYKRKNLSFLHTSIFNYKFEFVADCISANGFIEYLSIKDIKRFFIIANKNLKKDRLLIFGSRNRLFNLFSLNKFSEKEITYNSFKKFYLESIELNKNPKLSKFLKLNKNKFREQPFLQPVTGIEVYKRHQFSPLQIVDIMAKYNFKVIDIHPVNYHPVTPINMSNKDFYKKLSSEVFYYDDSKKLSFIPFSSTFMVTAKKVG